MDRSTPRLSQYSMLGFFTHPGTLADYLELLKVSISDCTPCTVLYHNLHSLYCYFRSDTLRKHYEGRTVLVDGMPLVWLYRLAGMPINRDQRVTYVDFIMPMMRLARDNGWRVYHLGQDDNTQQRALEKIRQDVPGIHIDGHHGYFDQTPQSAESLAVVQGMNEFQADLVLVGFGLPRQEAWVYAHREQIKAPALLTCGACMEYVAGDVRTPPRWMGRMGLEWSFRFLENPRRFAFRYLVEPVIVLAMLGRNWIQLRNQPRQTDN